MMTCGISQTLREYYSSDVGVWYLRKSEKVIAPNVPLDDGIEETIYNFDDYQIYIWRRKKSGTNREPAGIFFHGGGWFLHDIPMYRTFFSNVALINGITVVSVEYRRSDEAVFPG